MNQLKNSTSPYLLQHANNPVNWYPWGSEAFLKAKKEDKPIFLSIGYSTCHWCHVMAHESFEDIKTAQILNEYFISIKVDREERPDIDSVYMAVCQAYTGNGGWPTSIFMTWDKKPFYAGTYFPLEAKYRIPSFKELLLSIVGYWNNHRTDLFDNANKIIEHIKLNFEKKEIASSASLIEKTFLSFSNNYDAINGGFGRAPKFPSAHNLVLLSMYAKLNNSLSAYKMVEKTLLQMRKGGIFDHIGFGFSRYSTDEFFLVPHFEKMLYDNALLMISYSYFYTITNDSIYLETSKKIASFIMREMTSLEGGYYCAQDADIEGIEGKFYTFTYDEIINVLGKAKGVEFALIFDITKEGNFENSNILNLLKNNDISNKCENELKTLYEYRKRRYKLHLDNKILTSWNSLMIISMLLLYRISKDEKYFVSAYNSYLFIEKKLVYNFDIYTSFCNDKRTDKGFLDDYAFYIAALIEFYNTTLDNIYLTKAIEICDVTIKEFYDENDNGFYLSKKSNDELFMNPKEYYDGAIPSGNSVMTYNLVRIAQLTKIEKYEVYAKRQIEFMSLRVSNYAQGNSMFLISLLLYQNPLTNIVIVKSKDFDIKEILIKLPLFANVTIKEEDKEYLLINNKTTFYICKGYTCLPPTNDLNKLNDT